MKLYHKLFTVAAAAVLVAGVAAAQTKGTASRTAGNMGADGKFMTAAAQGGMAEVEMGRLATERASDSKVKEFGQRMVDDHTKANDELKAVATQKGITLPTEVDAKQRAAIDRLSKLKGAEFDRAYMTDMVKDHKEDVAEFQKEASSGTDTEVKNFASKTLPTLQEHLKIAESTESQVKK